VHPRTPLYPGRRCAGDHRPRPQHPHRGGKRIQHVRSRLRQAMKQQILTMLDLQDTMNSKVNADWRGQNFSWYRAIWIECAELMEHHGWKWWKKQNPDMDQVKLELVDIWHFGLSILLLKGESREQIASQVESQIQLAPPVSHFAEDLEVFTLATLQSRDFDVALFARLMAGIDLSFDELYSRYVGKNVLNMFRQDQGYQQGTY